MESNTKSSCPFFFQPHEEKKCAFGLGVGGGVGKKEIAKGRGEKKGGCLRNLWTEWFFFFFLIMEFIVCLLRLGGEQNCGVKKLKNRSRRTWLSFSPPRQLTVDA